MGRRSLCLILMFLICLMFTCSVFAEEGDVTAGSEQTGDVATGSEQTETGDGSVSNEELDKSDKPKKYPKKLQVEPQKMTLILDGTQTVEKTITIKNQKMISKLAVIPVWTSSNTDVATVDENGVVTAHSLGTAVITCMVQGENGELTSDCKVTIKEQKVKSISLDKDIVFLNLQNEAYNSTFVTPTIKPQNATLQNVLYSSSDTSIATVNENGEIFAVAAGKCVVTAQVENTEKKAKCDVVVRSIEGSRTITLTAGGDIVLGGERFTKSKSYDRFDQCFIDNGASYFLENMLPLFENDDLTILNLEGPLEGDLEARVPTKPYNYQGRPEYVKILTEGSVEAVNIENNHIDDFNTRKKTRNILTKAGIKISSTSIIPKDSIITVNDIRVGLVGFCSRTGQMEETIQAVKEMSDLVICSIHFTSAVEHDLTIVPRQKRLARDAIDAGADIVLGHHTHEPQGIELYKGKYIFYGLGALEGVAGGFKYPNFVFQQKIQVDLNTGEEFFEEPVIYPICTSGGSRRTKNNFQPVFLDPSDKRYEKVFSTIDESTETISCKAAPYIRGNQ